MLQKRPALAAHALRLTILCATRTNESLDRAARLRAGFAWRPAIQQRESAPATQL